MNDYARTLLLWVGLRNSGLTHAMKGREFEHLEKELRGSVERSGLRRNLIRHPARRGEATQTGGGRRRRTLMGGRGLGTDGEAGAD